jgi:hypothetical protein
MKKDFNRNEKQFFFNQIKGIISELNESADFCSITLTMGHEKARQVNFAIKKQLFDTINGVYNIGDKVCVRFYLSSKQKNGRWFTNANVLSMELIALENKEQEELLEA